MKLYELVEKPFCDGSHKKVNADVANESDRCIPFRFKCIEGGYVFLCNCKSSKNRPFCDGTHKSLNN